MKIMLLLFLTISLSSTSAFSSIANRKAAPSSDNSITKEKTGQQESLEHSDTLKSTQSSTARKSDWSKKSCRTIDGTWLRAGDMGYAACMDHASMMKK